MKIRFDRRRLLTTGRPPGPLFALAAALLLTALPPLVGGAGTPPPPSVSIAPPAVTYIPSLPLPEALPAPAGTPPAGPSLSSEPPVPAPARVPVAMPAPAKRRPPAVAPETRRRKPTSAPGPAAEPALPAIAKLGLPTPPAPEVTVIAPISTPDSGPSAAEVTAARVASAVHALISNPLPNAKLTSRFGSRRNPVSGRRSYHEGVDLAAPRGTPVLAPAAGRVYLATPRYGDGRHGRTVVLDHGNGVRTLYAHLDRIHVETGDEIAPGQLLGTVGTTGRTTGPHLHFEVHVNGRAVDPLQVIAPLGGEVRIVESPPAEPVAGAQVTVAAVPAGVAPVPEAPVTEAPVSASAGTAEPAVAGPVE